MFATKGSSYSELRRGLVALAGAATAIAIALAYAKALHVPWLWDDHVLVEHDAPYRHLGIPALFTKAYWPEGSLSDVRTAYYRPLVLLSFRIDALFGEASQYHFTNVFLHVCCALVLAWAITRRGGSGIAAVLAALVWGLAPRLTESVAWVSGRTDILAALFGLAAIGFRRGPVAGLLLLASLLSKEIGLAFAVALLVDRQLATALPPVGIYAVLRTIALAGTAVHPTPLGPLKRAATVLEAIGRYAFMTLDPLHPHTSLGLVGEVDVPFAIAGGVVALGAGTAIVLLKPKARVPLALVLASVALIAQALPLTLAGSVVADRLLYVPFAGVAMLVAMAAPPILAAAAVLLAMGSAVQVSRRLDDYQDETTFWLVAAEGAHAHNTAPRSTLATALLDVPRSQLSCRLLRSSRDILRATGREESMAYRRTRENLASCLARIGDYEGSRALSEALAHEHPEVGRIRLALGYARLHVFDYDGADAAWREAAALDPSVASAANRERAGLPRTRAPHAPGAETLVFYSMVGRVTDAEDCAVDLAGSETATRDDRLFATRFLLENGSLPAAERAVQRWPVDGSDIVLVADRQRLEARKRREARLAQLTPRIEALVP